MPDFGKVRLFYYIHITYACRITKIGALLWCVCTGRWNRKSQGLSLELRLWQWHDTCAVFMGSRQKKNISLGKLSRNLARIYSRLNLGFMVFTIYSSDLVYWAGFVIGVLFETHLSNANFIDFVTLWWQTVFHPNYYFYKIEPVFLIFLSLLIWISRIIKGIIY